MAPQASDKRTALGVAQAAVVTRLSAHPDLAGKVYARFPTNTALPYVALRDVTALPTLGFGTTTRLLAVTLDLWSESTSDAEGDSLLAACDAQLDLQTFPLDDGWTLVSCRNEHTLALRDPDGLTRHIAVRYALRVEKPR